MEDHKDALVEMFLKLYDAYRVNDSEMIEINPLALTKNDELVALDCKFTLDDSGAARRADLVKHGVPEKLTELEARAKEFGLKYIELDGQVGVLANGAGLTMTTMDVIAHHGGEPAHGMTTHDDAA